MTLNIKYKALFMLFVFSLLNNISNAQTLFSYPATRTEAFDTVIYNKKISDNYAWLSQSENEAEMFTWARTQGQYTNQILDSISGTEIIDSLLNKIYTSDQSTIVVKGTQGNSIFFTKMMPDNKRWLVRRAYGSDTDEPIIVMPFNINGKKYTAKKYAFGHHKELLALMFVEAGDLNPHIRFLDLNKKVFLKDSVGPVMFNDASGVSMAWLPDDSGLIYSQASSNNSEDEKYYRGKLRLHIVGHSSENDVDLFGFNVNPNIPIKDYETPYVYSFPHSPYIIARIRAGKGDNYAYAIHYSRLNGASTPWIKLNNYKSNHGTFAAAGDFLYAVDDAVPNMQLIQVDLRTGATPMVIRKESETILAMSTGDPSIVCGKNYTYIKYTAPGKQGVLKMDHSNNQFEVVEMPFDGTVGEFSLMGDDDLLFVTTNWTKDFEYHYINHFTNTTAKVFQGENATNITSGYVTKIIYVPSRDGVNIPVSLVYKKDNKLQEEPMPLLIEAYGCFGASMDPVFSPDKFIWLEMGGIYAAAHIRGGGELGSQWYAAGAYPSKMNSINDIVDIAQFFIQNNYTTADQQAITGASCGTLNVGLATLQRPDLFSAGIFIVGIPDLVTNKGPSFGRGQNDFGPLDTEEGFQSRYSISAYHHIVPNKSAPAMLVINGANDYIVPLHNVARYVAKLQNVQQSDKPSLFMVDWKNGHNGAGTEPHDIIRMWKFLFWQTGNPFFRLK
ncbi:MAG TPA: prolyl oligopeptidase family serine peptidase [Ferruginibacter sp.]|nr:prolyl oligopeptidase family serine peptidase [Ferruginibacter sp.]HRO97051.1 prolyl oligopeptidase family serine peptidase [Ferruginibacter sp.]